MEDDEDYIRVQDRRDAEYQRQYKEWIDSLSPEERRALAKTGLDQPSVPGYSSGVGMTRNAAESNAAVYHPSITEDVDEHLSQNRQPQSIHDIDSNLIWDIMRRLIGELAQDKNPGMTMDCATLVAGLSYKGNSMTEIAQKHGTTRAAVSKRCIEITDKLNLKPSRAMRSSFARSSYSKARVESLNKQRKEIYGNRNHH